MTSKELITPIEEVQEDLFKALCRWLVAQVPEAQAIMRKNGFAFTDLDDPWQKLAFTFYNIIVEASMKGEHLLEWLLEHKPK